MLPNYSPKKVVFGLAVLYVSMSLVVYYRRLSKFPIDTPLSYDVQEVKKLFDDLKESRLWCPRVCPLLIKNERPDISECPPKDDENDHRRFMKTINNCSTFLNNRGYIRRSMTKEEENFPLAYSLLVYCCPNQVEMLLRAIYRPQNYYCLHVDAKAIETFKQSMYTLAKCLPNVFVAKKMEFVSWGSFGVVTAELSCMKDLLRYKKWKYFINLTGQEFPLKTNLQIVRILKILNGANDINTNVVPRKLFRVKFFFNEKGVSFKTKEAPPSNMSVFSGSTHISATRAFVDFLINNPKGQAYIEWVNGTKIPDETIFSMLNGNPQIGVPGAYKGPVSSMNSVPLISRYKVWSDDPNPNCGGFFRRGVCVFGIDDLPRLVSAFQLFANKFTGLSPKELLTRRCLDEWLFNLTVHEYLGRKTFDLEKYRHLPQVYP